MPEKDGFPESYSLFPRLERAGKFIAGLFQMHQLASHGDHLFEHPLDTPIESPLPEEPKL